MAGIPLYINYDRIPENEYVDWVRKRVAASKQRAWLHILLGCVVLAGFLAANTILFLPLGDDFAGVPTGMAIGAMLGIMLGMAVVFAAWNLCFGTMALRGNRTEKLLLRYHDESANGEPEHDASQDGEFAGAPSPPVS